MKVIKVLISWDDFNGNDDIAALRVAENEYYIATEGERSMSFVHRALSRELNSFGVKPIK